ncbi:hypothetical protein llap_19109 [Limosa lapponica baueri]|uniref:Uncharacterized protein n=1 Tax=Limosa lapponica baueri TaxID=1758121 RepID=A0A2I0T9W1_LIMLA|nr:hypothetical protein llap_19109 [Limosa lapponica baueri]
MKGQRHEVVEDIREPVQEQSQKVERNRFLVALTSGLLWDVLEDHSGHNFNYVSCKLFSHLALTALSRAWLSSVADNFQASPDPGAVICKADE